LAGLDESEVAENIFGAEAFDGTFSANTGQKGEGDEGG